MKDLLRRHRVLKDEITDILNRQIKMEAHSSAAYLAMAAWCDVRGYDNSADFFFNLLCNRWHNFICCCTSCQK